MRLRLKGVWWGNAGVTLPPQFTGLDGVQAHGLRKTEGLVLNPSYNRLWENSADLFTAQCSVSQERKQLGYFLAQ